MPDKVCDDAISVNNKGLPQVFASIESNIDNKWRETVFILNCEKEFISLHLNEADNLKLNKKIFYTQRNRELYYARVNIKIKNSSRQMTRTIYFSKQGPGILGIKLLLPDYKILFNGDVNEPFIHIYPRPKIKVFLSYSRVDQEIAQSLYSDLTKAGITTWFDIESLCVGNNWEYQIKLAIQDCSYFILLLSSKSVSRIGFANVEIREALKRQEQFPIDKPFILPLRIDNCTSTFSQLGEFQMIDLFPYEEGIKKFLKDLRSLSLQKIGKDGQ